MASGVGVNSNSANLVYKRRAPLVRDGSIESRTVDDSQSTLGKFVTPGPQLFPRMKTNVVLDPAVLATGFFQDGLATAVPGQVASMTSANNFINFCKSHPDKPITNGLQIKTGSCNPAPMGILASTINIPSCKCLCCPGVQPKRN
jgi:hypothetical protein